jgi:hypothetical protein
LNDERENNMGYKASAVLYVGLRIDPKVLQTISKIRGCKHKETTGKFCSICGERMWKDENNFPLWARERRYQCGKFDVAKDNCESNIILIGKKIAEVDQYNNNMMIGKINFIQVQEKIRKEFEKEPWYNEKKCSGYGLC